MPLSRPLPGLIYGLLSLLSVHFLRFLAATSSVDLYCSHYLFFLLLICDWNTKRVCFVQSSILSLMSFVPSLALAWSAFCLSHYFLPRFLLASAYVVAGWEAPREHIAFAVLRCGSPKCAHFKSETLHVRAPLDDFKYMSV